MSNGFGIVKSLVGLATSAGASYVVCNAVKATTPANLGLLGKAGIWLGMAGLSGIAANAAQKQIESEIDELTKIAKPVADFLEGQN